MMKPVLPILFICLVSSCVSAQVLESDTSKTTPALDVTKPSTEYSLELRPTLRSTDIVSYLSAPNAWVDSVFQQLSRRERIGQLFMAAGYTNGTGMSQQEMHTLVTQYGLGGIVWFQGGPQRQVRLGNQLQKAAKVPLWYAMDAEWGIGMRLDSTLSYPYQMSLGAIQGDSLIEQMGLHIARDFRRLGLHVNFAPVADVNNNPENPVISFRSFGEDRFNVSRKALAYSRGLQTGGILTSGKHFPGHGDTNVDSHYALPVIRHPRSRLDSLELYPFRELIANGIAGIMIAHLSIPALDTTALLPSTLSKPIVDGLLRSDSGFKGLVFTDAMNMKGVTNHFPTGLAEVMALQAGNDVIELSADIPKAIAAIEKALDEGTLSSSDIDAKVKKVLTAKYWLGLDQWTPASEEGIHKDLNHPASSALIQELSNRIITIVQDQEAQIPVPDSKKTAIVSIGAQQITPFQQVFTKAKAFVIPLNATESQLQSLSKQLKAYDRVVLALHDVRRRPWNTMDLPKPLHHFFSTQAQLPSRIFVLLANPYVWLQVETAHTFKSVVFGYENAPTIQRAAAEVVLGRLQAQGRLPVSLGPDLPYGHRYGK